MDLLIFYFAFATIAAASKQIGQTLVKTGFPLISGFLLTGIVAGPYVLNLISVEATLNLRFLDFRMAVSASFRVYKPFNGQWFIA